MINKSIWLKNIKEKTLPKLDKDIKTDILIIGGGITGLSCAYFLKDSNLNITLVDMNKIAHGGTSKTTGKINYLQGVYDKIESIYDKDIAEKYLESQKYAHKLIEDIIINNNIKCDYQSNSAFLFTNSSSNNLDNEINILKKLNVSFKIRDNLPINFPCKKAIKIDDSAVFHPIKYTLSLKDICLNSGINMYENTIIKNLEKIDYGYIAFSDYFKIEAKKVILACFYPFFLKHSLFPFKTYIKKEYITASLIDNSKRFNAINLDKDLHSIRYHNDNKSYIIYVSESRKLGSNMDNNKRYTDLIWKTKINISDDIKYKWFNYDIMTPDFMPIIGYYEKNNNNLLIGTGYNAWGMTNGTLAGKIISDLIMGYKNKYIELFSPTRSINILKILNLINYNFKTSTSYVISKFKNNYSFYPKNVKVINEFGIYIDDKKKEHVVYHKCPHMGCNLIFNNVDNTWDCPCHGSRFNIDGKIINGPSVYDIKVK